MKLLIASKRLGNNTCDSAVHTPPLATGSAEPLQKLLPGEVQAGAAATPRHVQNCAAVTSTKLNRQTGSGVGTAGDCCNWCAQDYTDVRRGKVAAVPLLATILRSAVPVPVPVPLAVHSAVCGLLT